MGIEILSIESSFPKKFETIKELSVNNKNWDTNKIYSSTGINKRYISGNNENIITLSIESAKKLIKEEGKKPPSLKIFLNYLGITEKEFNDILKPMQVYPHKHNFKSTKKAKKTKDFDTWYQENNK